MRGQRQAVARQQHAIPAPGFFKNIDRYLFADAFTTDRKIMEKQISNYQFDDARGTLRIILGKLKRLYT
jgi:hypothetical protein